MKARSRNPFVRLLYTPGPATTRDTWQPPGSAAIFTDPNKLVAITDPVSATSAPSGESFQTVQSARFGQVLRGVSVTPGTGASGH